MAQLPHAGKSETRDSKLTQCNAGSARFKLMVRYGRGLCRLRASCACCHPPAGTRTRRRAGAESVQFEAIGRLVVAAVGDPGEMARTNQQHLKTCTRRSSVQHWREYHSTLRNGARVVGGPRPSGCVRLVEAESPTGTVEQTRDGLR